MVDISIINLHGEPAADPSMERVVGTIINEGDRAVSRLSIRGNRNHRFARRSGNV